jgi:hypothetical protein
MRYLFLRLFFGLTVCFFVTETGFFCGYFVSAITLANVNILPFATRILIAAIAPAPFA